MDSNISACIEAVRRIADMLCGTAIWDQDSRSCNWIGASPLANDPALRPLRFDLYDGLGGVALFLAAAHMAFGRPQYGETSIGALRAAHLQAHSVPFSPTDLSIFEGRFGLHFVTGVIGRMLDAPAPGIALPDVLHLLAHVTGQPHSLDVMAGSAGTICGLLNFEPHGFRMHLSGVALRLGEEILGRAEARGGGFAWPPRNINGALSGSVPLCGLSHGASGMAVTLLRLFERSGRAEFLAGARSAFRYEEESFDPQLGSWPDLRADTPSQRRFDAWCHGAGGIAIARLQAMRNDILLGDHHRSVAITALEKTYEALCESIDNPQRDEGLCHGMIGLGEICRIGGRMLSIPTFSPKVDQAAETAAERIIDMGEFRNWPGDVLARPGLMLGISGVGYGLLSLTGMRLPSVVTLFESFA